MTEGKYTIVVVAIVVYSVFTVFVEIFVIVVVRNTYL